MDEISHSTHAAAARNPNRERRSRLNLQLQAMLFEDELTNSSEEEGDLDQDWKRQTRGTGKAGNGRKTHKGFSTPPPKRPQLASPSLSSPLKLAVTFGGKVYRTLDQSSGAQYSSSGNFFGEPDEEVGDAEADRQAERKRELERRMMVKMRKKRVCSDDDDDDDDLVIQPPSVLGNNTPHKIRRLATPPPSSPTRQKLATTPTSSLGNPFEPAQPFPTFSTDRLLPPLHSSLTSLLALHVSLESTLIFHLAKEGSRVASSNWKLNAAGEATIRLENLITLPNLAKLLATDGKTLGERELSRLLWVWEGCGMKEEEGNVDELDIEEDGQKDVGGMGFIVTQTRYKAINSIVNCYGIGISICIKSNPQLPQFELIAPPGSPSRRSAIEKKNAPPSPSSIGRGREGMSVVALWSAGKSDRSAAFAARLRQWADRCEAEEKKKSTSQLPTPKRSRPNSPLESLPLSSPQYALAPNVFHLPPIPQAILPVLACAIPRIEGTSSPSPKRKTPIDVFGPAVPISTGGGKIAMLLEGKKVKVPILSSGDQRMQDMRDRLNVKSHAKKSPYQASLAELSQGVRVKKSLSRVKEMEIGMTYKMVESERYKRNSMLSRLGDVADVVWMLFDVGKRSMTMLDVASKVANSSKIPVSTDETIASLHLLCEVCPEYAYLKSVSGQDWLCMKGLITLKEAKESVKEELARSTSA